MNLTHIELRYQRGCPHVGAARELLRGCLARLGVAVEITELAGRYPSPTINVDGRDVMTGARAEPVTTERAACRLDSPTADRVLAALAAAPKPR